MNHKLYFRLLSGLLPPGFPPLPFMLPPGMQQQFPMSEMDLASMGGAVRIIIPSHFD